MYSRGKRRCAGTLAMALFLTVAPTSSGWAQSNTVLADSLFAAAAWDAAATAYAAVVRDDASNGQAWFRMGFARHQGGDYAAAIDALEKANDLGFAPQRVCYRLAAAHALAGKADAALDWLQRAVDAGFTNLGILRTDVELESLRGSAGFTAVMRAAEAAHACSRADCRRFDFWIGSWDVFNAAGTQVGRNTIRRVENGCALEESWTSAGGGTGSSINFYHPGRGKWVQTWFDGNGGIIDLEGEPTDDGTMRLEGTNYAADGTHELIRGTWTLLDDGRIRQFFEQSRDLGKTWYVWFDGYYVRQDSDAPGN